MNKKVSSQLKTVLTSLEFKAFITLLAVLLFLSFVVLHYQEQRREELFRQYNESCALLSNNLGDYFNESINITCDCYYEPVNTGVEELDKYTRPACSCDCVRDGVFKKVALRLI
jgi:hypothetical protein